MTGVALPILFKDTKAWPLASKLHRVVQVLGMAFLVVGLALGFKLKDKKGPQKIHKGVGIAVFALVWLHASPTSASFSQRLLVLSEHEEE